ncbi:chemotaxis signal transduction protein [Sorangium cellulosum]|uniref:Chemotaxis signal transduction protein n=1 Tax=Sorangium cellulosum TaxID=56 RepID=A0A2L0EY70_SORCE|nr:chemotaxis protein CheW [Sorangium cellulosum]AUX44264.1 chemotaxis signal transduction protein [Sorangium cellulosum]
MSDALDRVQELLHLHDSAPDKGPRERTVADFLLFDLGVATFALRAQQVEEVIAWRVPLPLPRADPRVSGIIQDRGRIVVILSAPAGEPAVTPLRIVVCRTPRGYLGLPAGKTRCVAAVKVYGELVPGAVVDTSEGVVTFLDVTHLLTASGGAPRPLLASREDRAVELGP